MGGGWERERPGGQGGVQGGKGLCQTEEPQRKRWREHLVRLQDIDLQISLSVCVCVSGSVGRERGGGWGMYVVQYQLVVQNQIMCESWQAGVMMLGLNTQRAALPDAPDQQHANAGKQFGWISRWSYWRRASKGQFKSTYEINMKTPKKCVS